MKSKHRLNASDENSAPHGDVLKVQNTHWM